MTTPRDQAEERRAAVRRALAGTKPLRMCDHAMQAADVFINKCAEDIVLCEACWRDKVLANVLAVLPCDRCGKREQVDEYGYRETLPVDQPLPSLPGFRGEVHIDALWICRACRADRRVLVQTWQEVRAEQLIRFLKAAPVRVTEWLVKEPDATPVLCAFHPGMGLFPNLASGCIREHTSIIRCTICDTPGIVEAREAWLRVPDEMNFTATDPRGPTWSVPGKWLISPVAYVCHDCGEVWPKDVRPVFVMQRRAA